MPISDELRVRITGDASGLKKATNDAKTSLGGLSSTASNIGKEISGLIGKYASITAAIVAVAKVIGDSTKEFASFEQNIGGAKAVFGDYASYLNKKAEEASTAVGMSINEYLQGANKIGAIMQGAGITQGQSLAMTTSWMERAADMASVMGETTETAMTAVTAAAKGNFMLMDNIGVKMNATTIEAYALSKGITTSYNAMSEAQKVGLAYQMFMEKTTQYAGNFKREGVETLQGALSVLKASFANLGTYLGMAFGPILMSVANFITGYIVPAIQAVIPYIVGFMNVIGQMVAFVGKALGSLFGNKGGGKQLAQNSDQTSKAMKNVAGGAGTTAKNLGKANKEAKKLKGQLASFDEMNVLAEPQQASGGGDAGGAGAGGGLDIPEPDGDALKKFKSQFDEIKKKAEEVANAITNAFKKAGEWIGNAISLKSFRSFRNGVESIIEPLAKHYKNIWTTAISQVQDAWGRSGQKISDGFTKTIDEIVNQSGRVLQSIGGILEAVEPMMTAGTGSMTGLFVEILEDWALSFTTYAPQIIESVGGLMTGILDQGIKPTAELIATAWQDLWGGAKSTWDTYGSKITDGIYQAFDGIVKLFKKLWDDIIAPIWEPFMGQLKDTWDSTLKPMLDTIFDFVGNVITSVLDIWNKAFMPVINFLVDIFRPIVVGLISFFTGRIDTAIRLIGGIINGIVGTLNGIVNFVMGVFSGNWARAWQGVTQIFSGIFGVIGAIAKAPLNFIIDAINGFIRGLNIIKIPDWVPAVGGKGFNIRPIPKLATGGIAQSTTIAMIGEAGKEAVLPLDRNTGWMDTLAEKIGGIGGNAPTSITVKIGEETIIDKVIDGINGRTSLSGRNAIIV